MGAAAGLLTPKNNSNNGDPLLFRRIPRVDAIAGKTLVSLLR